MAHVKFMDPIIVETVDHIDRDYINDYLSNLRILSRSEHSSLDVRRYKGALFLCPTCNEYFTLSGRKLHDAIQNRRKNKAGPFCSRKCAGLYGKSVQCNSKDKLKVDLVVPEYTTLKSKQSLDSETD